jgi:hypothetical protein
MMGVNRHARERRIPSLIDRLPPHPAKYEQIGAIPINDTCPFPAVTSISRL